MHDFDAVPDRGAHRLYAHVVWPTLGRVPLITTPARDALERHLIAVCRRLDAEPLCVRVLPDRAHVLLRFKPGHSVATSKGRITQQDQNQFVCFHLIPPSQWNIKVQSLNRVKVAADMAGPAGLLKTPHAAVKRG